ncbi:MAG: ornithine carbamoyltransferase [Thermoplasmata archaeon]
MTTHAVKRDLLSIADLREELPQLLRRGQELKKLRHHGESPKPLAGATVAMIFEKPSTRTRISFAVGVSDLGGLGLTFSLTDMQLGRGETIADTARVLSRYVDAIVYRAYRHADERELARWASVPVINALDDREHPCQVAADLMTLAERWDNRFEGHRLAYIGDGNNVCNSLVLGCAIVGLDLTIATPARYRPPSDLWKEGERLASASGSDLRWVEKPVDAAKGADALYTDVWVSMGDEAEAKARERDFQGYQINASLLAAAAPEVWVLHDLPAHRGLEITDDVMDGPRSVVWDEAENRLHAQKAILELLVGAGIGRASLT